MFNEINPKLSPYYVGAFSLSAIREKGELSFYDWQSLTQNKLDFDLSEKLFTLSVAWLYMIGKVEESTGGYSYV